MTEAIITMKSFKLEIAALTGSSEFRGDLPASEFLIV